MFALYAGAFNVAWLLTCYSGWGLLLAILVPSPKTLWTQARSYEREKYLFQWPQQFLSCEPWELFLLSHDVFISPNPLPTIACTTMPRVMCNDLSSMSPNSATVMGLVPDIPHCLTFVTLPTSNCAISSKDLFISLTKVSNHTLSTLSFLPFPLFLHFSLSYYYSLVFQRHLYPREWLPKILPMSPSKNRICRISKPFFRVWVMRRMTLPSISRGITRQHPPLA